MARGTAFPATATVSPEPSTPRPRRRAGLLLLLALLVLFIWVAGDLAFVRLGAEDEQAAPADVIVVLGCSIYGGPPGETSPCIRARAQHAAEIYGRGLAAHVIASGGAVDEERTEAGALTAVLEDAGVPASAILAEDQSHDTIQNILNSRALMRAHGWQTAILVSEPYHIKRATLIARDAGLTIYPSPAVASYAWQTPNVRQRKILEDTLSLMLYQIKAVVGIHT